MCIWLSVHIYRSHELIKFIKNLKNVYIFLILLHLCIKFQVQNFIKKDKKNYTSKLINLSEISLFYHT
jgi:hypothetical protein